MQKTNIGKWQLLHSMLARVNSWHCCQQMLSEEYRAMAWIFLYERKKNIAKQTFCYLFDITPALIFKGLFVVKRVNIPENILKCFPFSPRLLSPSLPFLFLLSPPFSSLFSPNSFSLFLFLFPFLPLSLQLSLVSPNLFLVSSHSHSLSNSLSFYLCYSLLSLTFLPFFQHLSFGIKLISPPPLCLLCFFSLNFSASCFSLSFSSLFPFGLPHPLCSSLCFQLAELQQQFLEQCSDSFN